MNQAILQRLRALSISDNHDGGEWEVTGKASCSVSGATFPFAPPCAFGPSLPAQIFWAFLCGHLQLQGGRS